MQAGEANKTKKKWKNNAFPGLPILRYIGRCLTGQAYLTAIVCISQSPQNGWETWFSCGYGQGLAKLQAPLKKVKPQEAEYLRAKLKDDVEKAKKQLDSTPA